MPAPMGSPSSVCSSSELTMMHHWRPYSAAGNVKSIFSWWALKQIRNVSSLTRSPRLSWSGMPSPLTIDGDGLAEPGIPVLLGHGGAVRAEPADVGQRVLTASGGRTAVEESAPAEDRVVVAQR